MVLAGVLDETFLDGQVGMNVEDAEVIYSAIQKNRKLGLMIGLFAQDEGRNVRNKWLVADRLCGERHREHPGYAMGEQMDLALSNAVKESVRKLERRIVVELMPKWVEMVWLR